MRSLHLHYCRYFGFQSLIGNIENSYLKVQGVSLLESSKEENVAVLGCGVSPFSEDLNDYGFKNILSVDYSRSAVNQMTARARTANRDSTFKYEVANVTNLRPLIDNESIDIIFDKGTLDTLLNTGDRSDDNVAMMISEVSK
jgi:hypothetical protein